MANLSDLETLDISNATDILERLIDRHGLTHIVTGLSLICVEKAEHIRTNWQDRTTAKAWDADGRTLDKAARLICSDG
jgi:hypothetical protein